MFNKIKIKRAEYDLPQWKLAEMTGLSQSRVSRVERGISKLTRDEKMRMQAVLKCRL